MQTIEAIKLRRSVKHFDTEYKISDKKIKKIIELAMLSPTSFNIQNWRFLVITDPELRHKIRLAAFNQKQISESSLLLAICADLKAWGKSPERYWENAPEEISKSIVPMLTQFYSKNEQLQRDEAIRSAGIAAQTIMLTAKDMGYDSCPMIGFDPQKVGELINLPKEHLICLLITIGKAAKSASPRSGQLSINEVLFRNKF